VHGQGNIKKKDRVFVLFVSHSEFLSLYIWLASSLPLEKLTNDSSMIFVRF